MTASISSSQRLIQPFGLQSGIAGKSGHNNLKLAFDQYSKTLSGQVTLTVQPGNCLTLKTPGGGGYGTPPSI
jgi:N-methylhydantoinase B/oxoprolinase/acetone carboxylase alpha subunit